MRHELQKRPPDWNRVLLEEVLSPGATLAAEIDLQVLFKDAYERLHDRFVDRAQRHVGWDDGRDVAADSWTAIWIALPTLPPWKRNDSYYCGVLRNFISDKLDKNKRLVSLDDIGPDLDHLMREAREEDDDDQDDGDRKEMAKLLDAAVATLAPRRREVVLLIYEESLTYEQAAAALGLSFGTIKTHLRLAMQELRSSFSRAGYQIANTQARLKQLPAPKGGDNND